MNNEEDCFELILKRLQERHGVDFSMYRRCTVERRLARRMAATGCGNHRAYLYLLEKSPEEYGRLVAHITIKVSRFFRNNDVFEILSNEIFPDIIDEKENKNDDTLRIWCAGCAYGEEAYSVAITLVEYMKTSHKGTEDFKISIFGTDIDEESLNHARLGAYDARYLEKVDKKILDRHFTRLEEMKVRPATDFMSTAHYQVIDSVRGMVHFSKHDLASETQISPPAGVVANYDLILCRNLLIYFSAALRERAFSNLFNSLNPGGYLVLGKSESIPDGLKTFLATKDSRNKVYKKKADAPRLSST
ncbi:MAG: protein-glutamate O-methyltransferase CheR [Desulfobacterales bacterium]|nr:protein-glutamate O-methyltransferase CheR [Desulfobacterales bacterium]